MSLPVVLAGWLKRVPIVVHESDVHPGLANRLSAIFARTICLSFEETRGYFPQKKTVLTGIPLRADIREGKRERAKELTGLTDDAPVVLFMGGGKGDPFINSFVHDHLDRLLTKYQLIHLGGFDAGQETKTTPQMSRYLRYANLNKEMPDMYALADIVVTRAGASTLAEIAELKKPCILIPMAKGCSRGEQLLNAKIFSEHNHALVIEEACRDIDLLHVIDAQLKFSPPSIDASNTLNTQATEAIIDVLLRCCNAAKPQKKTIGIDISTALQKILGVLFGIFCLPVCLIIAGIILLMDGSPIFFTQERVGKQGKKFTLYKFRTLQDGKETNSGHWLRASGLDELPQLINVIKSDMNLIGPRPLTEQDVIRLGWDDKTYEKRFDLKPGITGLGQLSPICDKELTWHLDTSYLERRTILLDAKILAVSVMVGMFGKKILKKHL